jgi:hypothetical protein
VRRADKRKWDAHEANRRVRFMRNFIAVLPARRNGVTLTKISVAARLERALSRPVLRVAGTLLNVTRPSG